VGYLPLGGLMKNGNIVSSLIYYRDLANGWQIS
jgi:hypothetical protein